MRCNAFVVCALAVLASMGAPGLAEERRLPPIVEEYATDAATIKATYSCSDVYSIHIELQKRDHVITLQSLKITGRTLSEADRAHVNTRLAKLNDFASYRVHCAEGGMVLRVHGTLRSQPKSSVVSIWWNSEGVRDLDFE